MKYMYMYVCLTKTSTLLYLIMMTLNAFTWENTDAFDSGIYNTSSFQDLKKKKSVLTVFPRCLAHLNRQPFTIKQYISNIGF